MHPELFTVGSITIHTYGVLVALGILAAVALAEYLFRRGGGEPGRIIDMAFFIVLGGLLGARLVYVAVNFEYFSARPIEILMLWNGGLVFYGGLIGGAVALLATVRIYRLPLLEILDVGSAAVCIGHAFGRLGCFSAGCCYGRPTDLPWGITFTNPECLAVDVLNRPVHPVQLYSFVFLAGLTFFLVRLYDRRAFPGQIAAVYLVFYGAFRFGIEFLRGDPRGSLEILGVALSVSQWISIGVFLIGTALYYFLSRRLRYRKDEY